MRASSALDHVRQGWSWLKRQCPVAAWASWNQALRLEPENAAAREALERLQNSSQLPRIARGPFRFRAPGDEAARTHWNERFAADHLGVDEAAAAFQAIVASARNDASARHNLALCLAWNGENRAAIEQLDALVRLAASDPGERDKAVEGWMLAEILRQGAGAEDLADDLSCTLEIARPAVLGDVESWLRDRAAVQPITLAAGASGHETEILEWLDKAPLPDAEVSDGASLPIVIASIAARDDALRIVAASVEAIRGVELQLLEWLGDELDVLDRRSTPLPIELMDLAAWRFRLPDDAPPARRQKLTREALLQHYQHTWASQPRIGLSNNGAPATPSDAAAQTGEPGEMVRIRLEAVLRVREQLLKRPGSQALHGGLNLDSLRPTFGLEPLDHHESA